MTGKKTTLGRLNKGRRTTSERRTAMLGWRATTRRRATSARKEMIMGRPKTGRRTTLRRKTIARTKRMIKAMGRKATLTGRIATAGSRRRYNHNNQLGRD